MNKSTPLTLAERQNLKKKPQTKAFMIFYLVLLPLWLVVLLPITILYMLFNKILHLLKLKKDTSPKSVPKIDSSALQPTSTKKDEREFDIVVFGATGFTGNFMCEYLSKNYELAFGKMTGQRKAKQVKPQKN